MSIRVQFAFDFGSPNAYLAHCVVPAIEARTGVRFEYWPVLLGGVFKATNNVSPAVSLAGIKNKGEYQGIEMRRFIRRHGIAAFQPNPHFPVNTLQIMRGAIVAEREGVFDRYVETCFHNMWGEPKKMDDPEIVRSVLLDAGLPVDAIFEGTKDPDVKQQLIDNTEAAVARGVFGSPSFFVGDELFFGKDSLRDVEDEIVAAAARSSD